MIWNVFLVAEVVEIWTMGHTPNTFIMSRRETGRAVDGGEVLPGFSVPVHDIFDGN
jgi:hypothetical protein